MNLSKSEVLVHEALLKRLEKKGIKKIELIPVVSQIKYLGVVISHNKSKVIKTVKKKIKDRLRFYTFKLKSTDGRIKYRIMQSFVKQLGDYHLKPMKAAGLLDSEQLKNMTFDMIRRALKIQNSVAYATILKVVPGLGTRFLASQKKPEEKPDIQERTRTEFMLSHIEDVKTVLSILP